MIVPEYGRMLDTSEWSPIIDELLQGQHFVITTHENSDGDGLGSEVALATVLQALGNLVLHFLERLHALGLVLQDLDHVQAERRPNRLLQISKNNTIRL